MIQYHCGEPEQAIGQQLKELIINETCLGLDHPDTVHSYANMALFYHGLEQTEFALPYMFHALVLLSLSSGSDHPDVAATFVNMAFMYQDLRKMNISLRYLQEALKKNERLLGMEHVQTALCYHSLAIIFNSMGLFKLSHQHEKKTYDILVKQLGEDDQKTQESLSWVNTFRVRESEVNAQRQRDQTLDPLAAQKALDDLIKARPELAPLLQVAGDADTRSGASTNKSLNAAMMGETLPRGRGVNERAARAAAIARKKAAARGLLVRPQVQSNSPLTQLLNIINSRTAPDVGGNGDANGVKKENGIPSSGPADATNDQSVQEEQAPAGLGKGLASLDAKKQKSKPQPKDEK
ncbi:hypothetical protein PIB30_063249 [Stylosanthes scabra]|uniref:Uncharacterized protein n=1 Tax=Stylosanthes scabra TaxID=79078 RepID=A0ABU6ZK38_9FABA|nr:hypothetical protein [Stylosanthes scabra]